MDLDVSNKRAVRDARIVNWPTSIPFFFTPLDEGRGSRIANYGNVGRDTLFVHNKKTQWRSEDGWYTTKNNQECAYPKEVPESAALLDFLDFFKNCTAASPGIGGEIMLISFVTQRGNIGFPQVRIVMAGMSGNHSDSEAWQLHLTGGGVRVFWRDLIEEAGNTMFFVPLDGVKHTVTTLLDAKNAAIYGWVDGVPQTIDPADEASNVAMFKQFLPGPSTQYNSNAMTITIGHSHQYYTGHTAGVRNCLAEAKSLNGMPLGELFLAEVTTLDTVLAARRDNIAAALHASPRGYLNADVSNLLTL